MTAFQKSRLPQKTTLSPNFKIFQNVPSLFTCPLQLSLSQDALSYCSYPPILVSSPCPSELGQFLPSRKKKIQCLNFKISITQTQLGKTRCSSYEKSDLKQQLSTSLPIPGRLHIKVYWQGVWDCLHATIHAGPNCKFTLIHYFMLDCYKKEHCIELKGTEFKQFQSKN